MSAHLACKSGSIIRIGSTNAKVTSLTARISSPLVAPVPGPTAFTAAQMLHSTTPQCSTRGRLIVTAAKKGGGGGKKAGGGGNQKKTGGLVIPKKEPYFQTSVIMHNLLLIESYFRKTGRPLFNEEIEISDAAKTLWEAPFAVLAHDTKESPELVYGNKVGLELFECTWEELLGTPSAKTAEDVDDIQSDRSQALATAMSKGFIDNYSGKRISFKGTSFTIRDATVFNIDAPSGEKQGQGAIIRCWEFEDGVQGGPNADNRHLEGFPDATDDNSNSSSSGSAAASVEVPLAEQITVAEEAVSEQGAVVRELKEGQGLGNSSEEVKAAVEELLARKKVLEELVARKK